MGSFGDRMYPDAMMKETLQIDEDEYEVEFRAPKWGEVIKAEARATIALKDVLSHPTDAHGTPLPAPPHEQRLINMQTGIELAKACMVRVGDKATAEDNFWDRLPVPIINALGTMIMSYVWDTEVGRKNSQKPNAPRKIMRRLRQPESPQASATPSSDESSSNVSYSVPDIDTPT